MFEGIPRALGLHSLDTHYVSGLCGQGLNGTKMMERRGPCFAGKLHSHWGGRMQGGAPAGSHPPTPSRAVQVPNAQVGGFTGRQD